MLEDIAVLTGGVVISEEKGLKLEGATMDMLGTAEKVTVDKDTTTIVNGAGDKDAIQLVSARSRLRSKIRLPTTIKKNCRNVWLRWPVVLPYCM